MILYKTAPLSPRLIHILFLRVISGPTCPADRLSDGDGAQSCSWYFSQTAQEWANGCPHSTHNHNILFEDERPNECYNFTRKITSKQMDTTC